jgi:transposase InsO family protein
MKAIMNLKDLQTPEHLKTFMDGTQAVAFTVPDDKGEIYKQIEQVLRQVGYPSLGKKDKGTAMRFLEKLTSYSRQQLTRLVKQYRATKRIRRNNRPPAKGFKKRYTAADVSALVDIDKLHGTPSGPVVKKLCERACGIYGETKYERLSGISVSHIYNLRAGLGYRCQRVYFHPTQSKKGVPIGVRKKPRPEGRPGFLRVDSVHQGDQDRRKGVYHINAVDEVLQFEVVVTVEAITENHMLSALEQIIEALPFPILGFHSDNGSEYINKYVARMLEKLHIELTKSRSRHSNDNALAESKNGSVVRGTFGYAHIPRHFAGRINSFNQSHLVPYLNFHRPCFFPTTYVDERGKEKKQYKYENLMTPYEKLKSLPDAKQYLKKGVSFERLDEYVAGMSDNEAARRLTEAKEKLFEEIFEQSQALG